MSTRSWFQPVSIVVLAAALTGMTTFAAMLRADLQTAALEAKRTAEACLSQTVSMSNRLYTLESDARHQQRALDLIEQELDRTRNRTERPEGRR